MIPRAEAERAALVYKETQPAIDALKPTVARNIAAKKTLGTYMIEGRRATFRGIALKCVEKVVWDNDKLLIHLGDKVKDFRKTITSKSFDLIKRRGVIK